MNNSHAGHRSRLKERYRSTGFRDCSDLHLLEMLLFYAIPRVDTNPIAHKLLEKFTDINGVMSAERDELLSVSGIGDNAWVLLSTVKQISDLLANENKEHISFSDKASIYDYFYSVSYSAVSEYMNILFLDYKMQLMSDNQYLCDKDNPFILNASLNMSLKSGEKYCIAAHIKPGSDSSPDSEDERLAYEITAYLHESGIELLNYLVVGKNGICSAMYKDKRKAARKGIAGNSEGSL